MCVQVYDALKLLILGTRIWTGKDIECSSEEDFDNNMQ